MERNPYSRFKGKELSLSDHLAIDRTILANERTLLAYGRTALALVIVGGSCIQFFEARWLEVLGGSFILAAVAVAIRGWERYHRMRAYVAAALDARTGNPEHPLQQKVDDKGDTSTDAPKL
jgi:putative membrane protein